MHDIESIRKQLDRGDFDPADAALNEALLKTPGDEELLALRGSLRHLQRRFQDAVVDFEAALAKQPDEANWHNALGKSLNNLRQDRWSRNHRPSRSTVPPPSIQPKNPALRSTCGPCMRKTPIVPCRPALIKSPL